MPAELMPAELMPAELMPAELMPAELMPAGLTLTPDARAAAPDLAAVSDALARWWDACRQDPHRRPVMEAVLRGESQGGADGAEPTKRSA